MSVNILYRVEGATLPSSTSVKGTPLTNNEIDGNFKSVKNAIEGLQTQVGTATIDLTGVQDGAVLVYSSADQKLVPTKQLSNQTIDAGQF